MTITKLTDLQLVLLSTAAARADGSLLPPPDSVSDQLARIKKAIPPLLKRQLVEEVDVSTAEQAWRDQDERRIGVIITDASRTAIGIDPNPVSKPGEITTPAAVAEAPVGAAAPRPTKSAQVLSLLRRPDGATLAELVNATGWLPHTTRAALTGLRKKGHVITRDKRTDDTCYRIAEAA